MSDGEKEAFHNVFGSDKTLFVATTLTTLLLAGSAYLWRANLQLPTLVSDSRQRASQNPDNLTPDVSALTKHSLVGSGQDSPSRSDAEKFKSSRSKERRRRGKDPFRDLLKSGKKLKALSKLNATPAEVDSLVGNLEASPLPHISQAPQPPSSSNTSRASSSRSDSSSRSRPRTTHQQSCGAEPPQHDLESGEPQVMHMHVSSPSDSAIPILSDSAVSGTDNSPTSSGGRSEQHDSLVNPLEGQPRDPLTMHRHHPLSTSSSRSNSQLGSSLATSPLHSSSDSSSTPGISPTHVHHSSQQSQMSDKFTASSQARGTWNWSNHHTQATSSSQLFSESQPVLLPHPVTASTPASSAIGYKQSHASQTALPTSTSPLEALPSSYTFPSLNWTSGSSLPASTRSPRQKQSQLGRNGNGYHDANGCSHSVPTRHTPTSSSDTNTPPPSLTTQTQLASLRGALEAARLREEKMRSELERYVKETELLRWESAGWRRREFELQAQIRHLAHQLQSYATAFAAIQTNIPSISSSVNPPSNSTSVPISNSNNSSSSSANPAENGYHSKLPSKSSQTQPPLPSTGIAQPSPLQTIPPANQLVSPSTMFSPLSTMHLVPSPIFYPYPPAGGYAHHQHPHNLSHVTSPSQRQPVVHPYSHQAVSDHSNIRPILFSTNSVNGVGNSSGGGSGSGPGSSAGGLGPGPSSTPGSSSVGSLSPDLGGGSAAAIADRGTQHGHVKVQMRGWIGIGTGEEGIWETGVYDGASSDDGESEVNEALADAILKRPGSIRLAKGKSRKVQPRKSGELERDEKSSSGTESQTEFMYPSLSDLGNVNWGRKTGNRYKHESGPGAHLTDSDTNAGDEGGDDVQIKGRAFREDYSTLESSEETELVDAEERASSGSQPGVTEVPAG
ncbi:hypothetical protein AX17_004295 [Amanita inopinata Kibby_2008]|nr:hypothetical protein AX17_004295 [Amanita inopinata Kibby_2008]